MIQIDLLSHLSLKTKIENSNPLVFDIVRKKWVAFTPEEHVRQAILNYLLSELHYPPGLTTVEKQIKVDNIVKRYDIVVYNRLHQPWLLAECKSPEIPISKNTLFQLLQYQKKVQCRYWVLSNGHQTFCADAENVNNITWLEQLPSYR